MKTDNEVTIWSTEGVRLCMADIRQISKKEDHDFEQSVSYVYELSLSQIEEDFEIRAFKDAIEELFEQGCDCSHDCCGCYFGGVNKIRHFNAKWMVTVFYSRNF